MSYCQLIPFVDGVATAGPEFSNSWGGAARIWGSLFDKYWKDPDKPHESWMGSDALWRLAADERLEEFERATLLATFDGHVVRAENFRRLALALQRFSVAHRTEGVDHLPAWARYIFPSDAEAIGFWHTSVVGNPWTHWDEEAEEEIPARLDTATYEVYDTIDKKEPTPTEEEN